MKIARLGFKNLGQGQGWRRLVRRRTSTAEFLSRDAMLERYWLWSCVSICLSVPLRRYFIQTTGQIELVLRGGFRPSILHCVLMKFDYLQKIRALPSETLSQTLDLENFATTSRSCCQQNSSTVELVDHSHDGRLIVAVYYTSVDRNALTPLLRILVGLVIQLVPTVGQQKR